MLCPTARGAVFFTRMPGFSRLFVCFPSRLKPFDKARSAPRISRSSKLSISLKSCAPFDRGHFSSRSRKDIKSRVISVHRFPIQRRTDRNNVIGGTEISTRDKIVMFAQQRREFCYLYAYLLDACHITDSDHPLVIEHVRTTARDLGYHSQPRPL